MTARAMTTSIEPNPYLAANFAPVGETTATDLPTEGAIPQELAGRRLCVGPNPVGVVDPATYHWFAGTGMVHGLRIRGGRAEWYRSRHIVDRLAAQALGRSELPGPGREARDGAVNINLTGIAGRTFALVEGGALPVEISYELESIARSDLEGTLQGGFTAHPREDPATGEQHVIAYEPQRDSLRYLVVDKAGRARTVADVSAPHRPMVHDVAITATSVIVLDLPVTFQPSPEGIFPFAWNPSVEPRVGLLPRSGDLAGLQWFSAPSCYVFHVMNAYDDPEGSGRAIVDVVRHPRMFDRDRRGPNEGKPILARWTLDRRTGKLHEAILDDRGCEFPRINDARTGSPYRFGYTAHWGEGVTFGPAMKHDVARSRAELHDYGPGRMTLEPVFVPRKDGKEEDDGWVISYVYDATRDTSDVVILDARDFAGPPVATIHLPVRVPFGFHGGWVPDPSA